MHPFQLKRLDEHKSRVLLRERHIIENRDNAILSLQGKSVVDFTSNDYLNLANNSDIKKAFIDGVQKYGLGSGSSAFISGYFKPHQQLEEAFCEFLNRDKAILFNSGYHANLGVLTALTHKNSVIIADKLCHASIIDGILLSRAKYHRFRHHDTKHAATLVKQHKNPILVTESIFSMQGNITDIKSLSALKATLIVDDAHGIGILGKSGKGICEHQNLTQKDVACLVMPLGKSFGSFGAIVSGSHDMIEAILQFSRTYCFTTALPPAISYATLTSLKIMQQESWRREELHRLINLFVKGAHERGLSLISSDQTPIKSILVGSNSIALEIQKNLLQKGMLVSCIRPPTVPANTSRIRISLNCMHTEAQVTQLLDELHCLL